MATNAEGLYAVWIFEKLQLSPLPVADKDNVLKTFSKAHIAKNQCCTQLCSSSAWIGILEVCQIFNKKQGGRSN